MAAHWWDCMSQGYASEMQRLANDPEEKKKREAEERGKAAEKGFRHFSQAKRG